ISGFNIAYELKETRNIIQLNSTCFFLNFVLMAYFILALSLVALMPAIFSFIHLPDSISTPLLLMRWPLLFCVAMMGLQILYYYGPN
ncbi:YihY/virulence factor BrkB family protein, partial [Klebsiella pneumoniae]|nr:YihY/virulence factor BrkB family protein [Klebsiella pneumoniae]